MTVLNFPASPSNGQTYTENGVVYTWNGSYWSANNASDLGNIYVAIAGDRMTGQLELPGGGGDTEALQRQEIDALIEAGDVAGDHWDRATGTLSPKVSSDNVEAREFKHPDYPNTEGNPCFSVSDLMIELSGDGFIRTTQTHEPDEGTFINCNGTAQFYGDVQMASQNSGPIAGFRNQLINSDFRIIQRLSYNTTQTVTLNSTEYFADRWAYHSATTGTCRVNTSLTFPNYTMRQGANVSGLRQPIELPATGACGPFVIGSTWTASVWCNTDLTSADFSGPLLIFSDGPAVTPNSVLAADAVEWTSTGETINGFTRYYSTQTINQAPNATNVCLEFVLQGKNAGVNLAFDWAHVQFEPGPVATPFEHRPLATEIALCERYYQKVELGGSNKAEFMMVTSGGSSAFCTPVVLYLSPMRNVGNASNLITDRTNLTGATGANSFTGTGSNRTPVSRLKGADGSYVLCCGISDPPLNTTFSLRVGGSVTVSAEF